MQTPGKLENILETLKPQIEQLLVLLSQKEKFVIQRRFNLDNKNKATLEEIGQHFEVTRERIRQIERNALQKLRRNVEKFQVFAINDAAYEIIRQHGGVIREDALVSKLLTIQSEFTLAAILLILSLDKRFQRHNNTIHYYPYCKLTDLSTEKIEKICEQGLKILKKRGDLISVEELAQTIKQEEPSFESLDVEAFLSSYSIYKSFKVIDRNIGLVEWRHIHPRTLRDKIYFILRKKREPMHFVDIANAISETNFDKKNLNLQAIHNELIRHGDFVLIGRGIYALREWGYEHGTVSDVITSLLKIQDSMSEEDIIAGVLQKRKVKPITVILNLKNKSQFTRIGRKRYSLK